ncbi:MAG: esterase [Mycobacterium sp.]|nr:esterase [Mycobacterium sp.]
MVLVQGEILAKYRSVSGADGPLGLPIGDEQPAPNGGRRTIFGGGAIYWSPQTGAHIVRGAIRTDWEYEYGGAGGPLGYPTSDEQPIARGWQSQFQHGTITYTGGQPHVEIAAPVAGSSSTR